MTSRRARNLRVAAPTFLLVCVLAVSASAGHQTASVQDYTGCLNLKVGHVRDVAVGTAPLHPCSEGWVQIHLSGGDITEVVAGAGLAGGSTNGSDSVSLNAPSDGTPPNAGSNLVHWDVLNGVPAGFADGVDDTGGGTIPSGTTVRGTIGAQHVAPSAGELAATASLPAAAPIGLTDTRVEVAGLDGTATECPGTAQNPTAAPGYACVYPFHTFNADPVGGFVSGSAGEPNPWGFQVLWSAGGAGESTFFANWAYTAP
jgi:hypothetical protein